MHIPKYCHHKARDLGYVTINGRVTYLGPYNTPESLAAYYKLVAEYTAQGSRRKSDAPITVTELIVAYHEAITTFRLSASSKTRIATSLRLLRMFYASLPAHEITPFHLKACREHWIQQKLTRNYINILTGNLIRMLRWAAEELLIPIDTYRACEILSPLKAGRCTAAESVPVAAISRAIVEKTLPHCSKPVRALIELQWLTGARPGELLRLTPGAIDTTDAAAWRYEVREHKTAYRGQRRTIYFGPQAQAILRPFMLRPKNEPCFSPRESYFEMQHTKNPRTRPEPRYHRPRKGTKAPAQPKTPRRFSPFFDVAAYRRHIARACAAAGIDSWHPHQLRHAAATRFREERDLDVAQVLLGHNTADATQRYAQITDQKAKEAAARLC